MSIHKESQWGPKQFNIHCMDKKKIVWDISQNTLCSTEETNSGLERHEVN